MTDKLSDVFDIEPVRMTSMPALVVENKKIETDADFARANIRQLIEISNRALEHALELSVQSDSPRAYEVLANLINTAADLNTKLIDVHAREQKIASTSGDPEVRTQNITNNVVFTGTTAELNNLITEKLKR